MSDYIVIALHILTNKYAVDTTVSTNSSKILPLVISIVSIKSQLD